MLIFTPLLIFTPGQRSLCARASIFVATTLLVAGCGLQMGSSGASVSLIVTRDFGRQPLVSATIQRVPSGASAITVLKRRWRVALGPSGSVSAIDGVSAGSGERWQLYVDGVAAGRGTEVHAGERLWWDLERGSIRPPAVVGSFPEPFLHGLGGRRYPAAVECAGDVGGPCRRVTAVLTRAGVPVASQALGGASGTDSLAVVVGTWREVRQEVAALLLTRGPRSSGVFASFGAPRGSSLELLDDRGAVIGTLRGEAGLIAAITQGSGPPTWLVTGTDEQGVAAAAREFAPGPLRDHFALAVGGGRVIPVPTGSLPAP